MKKKSKKIEVVDKYAHYADIDELYSSISREIKLQIPSNFRMLCAILSTKPEQVLECFMSMLSYSSANNATEEKQEMAKNFFVISGFGRSRYSKEDIITMFNELKAMRTLYDTIMTGMKHEDLELYWKNDHMYIQFWFKRWFEKYSRKDDISILEQY